MRFRFPDKPVEVGPHFLQTIDPSEWIAQSKYDGWRAIIFIDGQSVRFMSRQNTDLSSTHSRERHSIIAALKVEVQSLGLPTGTVLDAELVGPRGKHDWAVYIFDCLAWGGTWLNATPYGNRWQKCCQEIGPKLKPRLFLAETIYGSGDNPSAFLDRFNGMKRAWEDSGKGMDLFEGLVLKRRTGLMRLDLNSNQKSNSQFKLKFRDIRSERF